VIRIYPSLRPYLAIRISDVPIPNNDKTKYINEKKRSTSAAKTLKKIKQQLLVQNLVQKKRHTSVPVPKLLKNSMDFAYLVVMFRKAAVADGLESTERIRRLQC
jgi:hypothetical protein